jgi:hypothetical protein
VWEIVLGITPGYRTAMDPVTNCGASGFPEELLSFCSIAGQVLKSIVDGVPRLWIAIQVTSDRMANADFREQDIADL